MTEAMLQGLDFFGTDINPLAILVSQAKSDTFDFEYLDQQLNSILLRACSEPARHRFDFPNIAKWFVPHVIEGLSNLRAAIVACDDRIARRFWWVTLAETIRLSSNSRTSTVKLHIRPSTEIDRRPDPVVVFEEIARRNLRVLRQQHAYLEEQQLLNENRYSGRIDLRLEDARSSQWNRQADVMITSPPYGDNHTTVTYGQASYLPLRWIDREDIQEGLTDDCVVNTHRLDTMSLGGSRSRSRHRQKHFELLLERSPHLTRIIHDLKRLPSDRIRRILTFYADLDESIDVILHHVRPGGLLVWITGNRNVGGCRIPMDAILQDLLGTRVTRITSIERTIPNGRKRMPQRNRSAVTMKNETVLITRRSDV